MKTVDLKDQRTRSGQQVRTYAVYVCVGPSVSMRGKGSVCTGIVQRPNDCFELLNRALSVDGKDITALFSPSPPLPLSPSTVSLMLYDFGQCQYGLFALNMEHNYALRVDQDPSDKNKASVKFQVRRDGNVTTQTNTMKDIFTCADVNTQP